MIPVQPTLISQPFANGGEKNVIPNSGGEVLGNASYTSGFPRITETPIELGGVPPQRKDFNGILNAVSSFNFFQQSGGVFAYSNTINYIPGCVVRYSNTEFVCITENGVDSVNGVHSPADATYWKKHTHPFIGINSTGINAVNFDGGGAIGADAIAIGKGTVSRASASVAVGSAALGDGTHSVAIGYGAQAKPQDSVAIGNTAIVATNGVNSVAIGRGAQAREQVSVAIGSDALVSEEAANSVAIGSGAFANASLVVSVGNGNQNRRIVNMADGTDEKDAVNVSQLNAATTAGTKAQLDAGTNTATKVWSPKVLADYAKGESLLENNGYIKHQSGLMIQWGKVIMGNEDDKDFDFNVPFPSQAFAIYVSQTDGSDSSYNIWGSIKNRSTFTVHAASGEHGNGIYWLAIGV